MEELIFPDFQDFAEHFYGSDTRIMLAGPEASAWRIRVLELPRLYVQSVHEGAANFNEGATWEDAVQVFFPVTDPARINVNGLEFDHASFAVVGAGQSFSSLARGDNSWISIGVPVSMLAELLPETAERRIPALATTTTMHRTQHHHQARLARIARHLTDSTRQPALDSGGAATRSAEDELLYSLALAFEAVGRDTSSRGRPRVPRRTIIDLACDWMEAHVDEAVHVTDLSNAAQVSVRTLRNAFVECYGIGPHTYLAMRQLHQIRAALLTADPSRETITGVSMRCGVWDLERMTARYKRLFGETPSQRLRCKGHRDAMVRGQRLDLQRFHGSAISV